MKIYFTSSISGLEKYRKNCEYISKYLKEQGYEISDIFLTVPKETDIDSSKHHSEKVYKYITNNIDKATVFIAEMSYRSAPVSFQLTYALQSEKPVLYLYDKNSGHIVHSVFKGNPTKYLFIKQYDLKNINKILDDFIFQAKKLQTRRFNFLISSELDEKLGIAAVKKRISKGEYVRQLLETATENDKRFLP